MKLFLGSLYTVISVSLITGVVFFIGGSSAMPRTDIMLFGILVSSIVAVAFVVIFAIPTYVILNKYKKQSIKWYLLAGFVTGPIYVFITQPFGNDLFLIKITQSVYCGVIGMLGAVVFWWFVVRNKRAVPQVSMITCTGGWLTKNSRNWVRFKRFEWVSW